jgi:hypothetical protein
MTIDLSYNPFIATIEKLLLLGWIGGMTNNTHKKLLQIKIWRKE